MVSKDLISDEYVKTFVNLNRHMDTQNKEKIRAKTRKV